MGAVATFAPASDGGACQLVGDGTGGNAAAGKLGEYVKSHNPLGSALSLTSTVQASEKDVLTAVRYMRKLLAQVLEPSLDGS